MNILWTESYHNIIHVGGRGRGTPGGGRGRGGPDRPPSSTLMVFNLNFDTEPYTLEEIFKGCNDVYLPKNRETGEKRGWVINSVVLLT